MRGLAACWQEEACCLSLGQMVFSGLRELILQLEFDRVVAGVELVVAQEPADFAWVRQVVAQEPADFAWVRRVLAVVAAAVLGVLLLAAVLGVLLLAAVAELLVAVVGGAFRSHLWG
jgi:hypothetical protein